MEKAVNIFRSFREASQADREADMRLTAQERLQIVIQLRERAHPDASKQGLVRVCRVTKFASN